MQLLIVQFGKKFNEQHHHQSIKKHQIWCQLRLFFWCKTVADLNVNCTPCYNLSVDIGANLTNKKFSRDLDQVIQRARDAGTNNL